MECINKEGNVICNIEIDGKAISLKLNRKILPYLVNHTPRLFFFNIYLGDRKYTKLLDLSNLSILPEEGNKKLRVVLKREFNRGVVQGDRYSIARGESFIERYLSPNGWQKQEYFYPLGEADTEISKDDFRNKESKLRRVVDRRQVGKKSAFRECPYCGAILSSELDYCPYCQRFIGEQDDKVDLTI